MPKQTKNLNDLLLEWQRRLRLTNWNVKLVIQDHFEDHGACDFDVQYKEAQIILCSEDTMGYRWGGKKDIELNLIHELIHLHGSQFHHLFDPETMEMVALETMIEMNAQAMLAAKRGLIVLP